MEWLINWLWQGLALTAIAAVALSRLRRLNAATRHRVWWVTLWLVLLLPLLAPQARAPRVSGANAPPSSAASAPQSAGEPGSASAPFVLDGAPDWTMNAVVILWTVWCGWSLLRATGRSRASGIPPARRAHAGRARTGASALAGAA